MARRGFPGMRLPGGRYRKTAAGVVLIVFFALLALLRPVIAPYLGMESETVTVTKVIDGDTIVVADGRHVRYLGIDTPEMDGFTAEERRLAREAKEMNSSLVLHKTIRLQYDSERKDKYGRTLAYIWVDDTLVNQVLVEAGLAKANDYGNRNLVWWDRLAAAQSSAIAARKGIWASR